MWFANHKPIKEIHLPTRIIKWIFVASIVVLLSIAVFLYLSFDNLFTSYNLLNHSNTISLKLEQAISYLKDAETSQRGFLLTKDSMYLEPNRNAEKKVWNLLSDLDKIIYETEQKKNLTELKKQTEQMFQRLATTADYYANDYDQERKKTILMQCNIIMSKIRLLTTQMQQYQTDVFITKNEERKYYSLFTPFLALALIITALFIISAAFYQLSRQLSISRDFQKKLSESNIDLEEKKNELERSNEELESFNYIASHDLKEPIRKIKTFSGMIMDTDFDKLTPKNQHYFQRLVFAADRMQLLLNDLMAYTRVNTTQTGFTDTDLNEVMHHLTDSMKETIEENNAVIETKNLPVIKAIPFQITQLFENLISNSIKYRKADTPPCISIQCRKVHSSQLPDLLSNKHEQYYKIEYCDNGIGFSEEYANKIFELFFRLHTSQQYPGTGIGLTICKKIVQNHHGIIRVFSEENNGTRFDIYLPA